MKTMKKNNYVCPRTRALVANATCIMAGSEQVGINPNTWYGGISNDGGAPTMGNDTKKFTALN